MELISKDSLYNKMVKQEELALKRVLDTPITINGKSNPCYFRYSEQHNERSAFKNMIFDEPTVKAIPIPEGATNGDVVEKNFGKDVYCTLIRMMYSSCCEKLKNWWNAPYKGDLK